MRRGPISKILLILGVFYCAWPINAGAQESLSALIDVHAHLLPDPGLSFEEALVSAIKAMNANGIATTILMSPPRPRKIPQNYDIADFRSALKKYPGRFVYLGGGGTLNPIIHTIGETTKVADKARIGFALQAEMLLRGGAGGFGEMGGLHISLFQKHGYSFVSADHPLFRELADIAAKHDRPIDLHLDAVRKDMKVPSHLAAFPNNPKTFPATLPAFERLLSYNRKAKIVWAHGGTDHLGDFGAETISNLMDRHSNLFVSLKIAGPKSRTQNKVFTRRGIDPAWHKLFLRHPDRFVIGTDSFYAGPNASGPASRFSSRAPARLRVMNAFLRLLPPGLARKFGRENAIRIYRLSPDQAPAHVSGLKRMQIKKPVSGKDKGLCRDGNMEHCKIACQRGRRQACRKLKRGE